MDKVRRISGWGRRWPSLNPVSSVRGRIISGFALLVVILVGVAFGSALQVRKHQTVTAAMQERADTAFLIQDALVNVETAASALQRYITVGDETLVAGDEALITEIRGYTAAGMDAIQQATAQEEKRGDELEATRLRLISSQAATLVEGVEQIIELRRSGSAQEAAVAVEATVFPYRLFEDSLREAAEYQATELSDLRDRADRTGDIALWLLVISGAAGAVLGLAAAVFIARSILKPLSSLESTAHSVAGGDLGARATSTGPRELAALGASLNSMTESLLDASKRRELEEERKQAEEALRESEHLLLESQSVAQIGSYVLDIPSGVWESSPVLDRIFGIGEDYERSVEGWLALVHPDVRQSMADHFAHDVVEQRGRFDKEYRVVRHDDGTERWVLGLGELEFDAQGRPRRMIGTIQDITERKQAEEALARASRQSELILNSAVEGIYGLDLDGNTTFINPAAAGMIGWEPEELIGKSQHKVLHHSRADGSPYPRDECPIYAALKDGTTHHVESEVFWRKDGTSFPVEYASTPIRDEQGELTGAVVSFSDITERKRAEETIRHLAYHDALTDLPNRALFIDRVNVALTRARRTGQTAALMFLDLDRFKLVNDTVGHGLGDELLKDVAHRLTGLVREGDTVARAGGDEFTLLLPDIERTEDVFEVAERIVATLRQPWLVDGHEFRVTASIGIAMYPDDGDDPESLLAKADTAMYQAKDEGRDTFRLHTEAMNIRIAERVDLESGLRRGLERSEFVVHYQPQFDLQSGAIVGAEALVRWQHPEQGLLLPGQFISVAEDSGLILPLDEWVLRTACVQGASWQQAGRPPVKVAVNLSARGFQAQGLTDTVRQILTETGLDPELLQLEITEATAMREAEFTITMLDDLREMGVQIAIDDFGTGHSSLSYLKRLPIDIVKIDQSFVRDLTDDPNDAAIARTIIAMAHILDLKVIAEGVETEEQLAFLKNEGCDEAQGFLFSKPMPAEDLEDLLRKRAPTGVRPS